MPHLADITNISPVPESKDVALDSDIKFDVNYPDGINPDTLNVSINGMPVIVNGVFQSGYSGNILEI